MKKWELEADSINAIAVVDESGNEVCLLEAEKEDLLSQEDWDKANLIAAAPEMLDALIEALSDVPRKIGHGGRHTNPTWLKIAAAIDKAQGRV